MNYEAKSKKEIRPLPCSLSFGTCVLGALSQHVGSPAVLKLPCSRTTGMKVPKAPHHSSRQLLVLSLDQLPHTGVESPQMTQSPASELSKLTPHAAKELSSSPAHTTDV